MQLCNLHIVAKFVGAGVKRSGMSRLHCHVPSATSIPSFAVLGSDTKKGQLISSVVILAKLSVSYTPTFIKYCLFVYIISNQLLLIQCDALECQRAT